MKIIEEFNEYSGLIETGGGYGDLARIDRDKLLELINRLPSGDIVVTTAPHKKGFCILAKPAGSKQVWHTLSPVRRKQK